MLFMFFRFVSALLVPSAHPDWLLSGSGVCDHCVKLTNVLPGPEVFGLYLQNVASLRNS